MASSSPVVAHVIVGAKPEVYLGSMLESIADACDHAVVNDTSGLADSPHRAVIEASRVAREGRMTHFQSGFVDFATARNACIDRTPAEFRSGWALVVDADEVHAGDLIRATGIASKLPSGIDAVDGYLRHFVGSFSWWLDLNRTRFLFRMRPERRWQGSIHERVRPLEHRIALPLVWFHYGHVILPREEAQKGRLYAALGQAGRAPSDEQIRQATAATVWPALLRKAIPYRGAHPVAVRRTVAAISRERAEVFAQVDALASQQTGVERLRNASRRLNTERLLRWRAAWAWMRWGWRSNGAL